MISIVYLSLLSFSATISSSPAYLDIFDQLTYLYLTDRSKCRAMVDSITRADEFENNEAQYLAWSMRAILAEELEKSDSAKLFLAKKGICQTRRCQVYDALVRAVPPMWAERGGEAIDHYLEALQLVDDTEDPHLSMVILQNIAMCYYWMNSSEQSLKYSGRALDLALQHNNLHMQAQVYELQANIWEGEDDLKADSLRQLFADLADQVGKHRYRIYAIAGKAWSLANKDQDDSARAYFQQAFDLAQEHSDTMVELEILTYLAENSYWLGDYLAVRAQYQRALSYPQKFIDMQGKARAYQFWAEAEAAMGDYEKAFEYMQTAKKTDDEYWDITAREKTFELEAQYESARKDAQLAQQELKISRQANTRNILFGTVGLLTLLGAVFIGRFRLHQRLTRQELALEVEKNHNLQQRQKLLAIDYMVQGQEEERKRIAKDLHDGLGSLLSAARMQLGIIQREIKVLRDLPLFEQTESLIGNAHAEVRRIAHNMMPEALMNFGLKEAIEDLAHQVNVAHDVQVVINFESESTGMNEEKEVMLYRIAQEALNNALKHAQASTITIDFLENEKGQLLRVEDNGIGFDSALQTRGAGLRNIRSRADYLNGTIVYTTPPHGGTRLELQL